MKKFHPGTPKVDAPEKNLNPRYKMAGVEIKTTQLFNRSALGALWARKKDFDDATRKTLDSIYINRKKGGATEHGESPITYRLSRSIAGQMGYGRLYGTRGSLETLQAECRASLCKELYHDLDIVNCQPCILGQFANRSLGVDMLQLAKYVENRDSFLAKLQETNGLSRDDAKQLVISIIYGAFTRDPSLVFLSNEVRGISKELSKLPAFNKMFTAIKSEKNHYGSFLAYLLQSEERECMLAMREFLTTAGWSVDVLSYDGVMVRRRQDAAITEDLLIEMAHHVKEKTGYLIQIKEKEQVGFDLPAHVEDPAETVYKDMKAAFEKNHFYFDPTNTICKITGRDGIRHYNVEHAMISFNTMVLPGNKGDDDELFIKRWIKDPSRRFVSNMVYKLPEECEDHEASLFTGFAYQDMEGDDEEAVAHFKDLLSCCCGDEAAVADYVLKYFAHMIQKPFDVPGIAVIFSSRTHGTGKDTLLNIMRRIIGRHSKRYGSETQFWNGHDTGREGAILIHLEEVGSQANKKEANGLKALITGDTININPKQLKPYDVPNIARIMMTTNEPDPIKLEGSDRRFLMVNPSDRLHAKGLDWWADVQEKFKNEAFLHTVGQFLEKVDLTGWNPRIMPMTEVKKDMLEWSKPQAQEFLEYLVADTAEVRVFTGLELFKNYQQWYKEQGGAAEFAFKTANSFGMKILPYKDKLYKKKHGGSGSLYYVYPGASL